MRSAEEKAFEAMLRRVLEGRMDVGQLAAAGKLTLGELAAWGAAAQTVDAVRGLRILSDLQTQLMLSRYRMSAVVKLLQLAQEAEDHDVARKACVDLLKMDVIGREERVGEQSVHESVEQTPAMSAEELMKALRELGGEEAR